MLDIGFSEILLIFVLGLIVLGPEKLPRVAAQVGRWIGRARAMARQFREQLEEEVTVEETRKKTAKASSTSTTKDGDSGGDPASGSTTGTTAGGNETGSGTASSPSAGAPTSNGSTGDNATGASTPDNTSQHSASAEAPHQDLTNEPWPYVTPPPPPEVSDIFHDVLKTPVPGAATVPTSSGAAEGAAGAGRVLPPESAPSARVQWAHDHEFSEATTEEVSSEASPTTHEREP